MNTNTELGEPVVTSRKIIRDQSFMFYSHHQVDHSSSSFIIIIHHHQKIIHVLRRLRKNALVNLQIFERRTRNWRDYGGASARCVRRRISGGGLCAGGWSSAGSCAASCWS